MSSPTQRAQLIRFALDTLGETNGHHDFERICFALARRRIASNLIPATGPVGSGGDQGRDAESHWTGLANDAASGFAALVSAEKVVLACTIQKSGVPAKIRQDLASICRRGDKVSRVVYFTVAGVPVGTRHLLEEEARSVYGVALDIWDGRAIAEHLSDPDLASVASEFLHLPGGQEQLGAWRMPLPSLRGVVERADLVDAVVDGLRTKNPPAPLIGIEGAGGFGKTTVAALVCQDSRVRNHFPDGLLWLTMGQNPSGGSVVTAVNELVEYLTGRRPTYLDPLLAGRHLADVIGTRKCLLVLDDVWRPEQLDPFLIDAPNCGRLITTRMSAVIPAEATSVKVDAFTEEQAEAVLGRGLSTDHAAFGDLSVRAGRWPVLCGLINGTLRRQVARGDTVGAAIEWASAMLDHAGPAALDTGNATARHKAIAATISASLTMLAEDNPNAIERYHDLGVFPSGTEIALDTLARYWARTGGVTRAEVDQLCRLYADTHLVEEFRLGPPMIRLHDVIANYLHYAAGERARTLHRQLIDSHRTGLPSADVLSTAWWRLPAGDPYLWRNLAFHLHEAGWADELAELTHDLRWASMKLHRLGAAAVEAETAVLPEDPSARALVRLLRGTSHLYQPGDSMMMTITTFAAYAAGDPVLAAAATALVEHLGAAHLRPTTVSLPDQAHPAISRVFTGFAVGPTALAVAPGGEWIAAAEMHSPVRVWDPRTGVELLTLAGSDMGAWTLAAAPDGAWLAAGGTDGVVRLWRMPDGAELTQLTGLTKTVWAIAVAPDGSWLAAGGDDETVRIWNLSDGTERAVVGRHYGRVKELAVAADGSWLIADRWVWHAADGRTVMLGDGRFRYANAYAVAPDGSWFAAAIFDELIMGNPLDGKTIRKLKGHTGRVSALAVAPDGSWLASAGADATVRIWDPASGSCLTELAGHSEPLTTLAVSRDGNLLASAGGDRWEHSASVVRLWNTADRTAITALTGHSDEINTLAVAPDSSWIASGAGDRTLRIWDVISTHRVAGSPDRTRQITAVAMAPDGSWAASADGGGSIRLWNTADGSERAELRGHTDIVTSLVVAPDGSWLASASHDHSVKLWNIATGTCRTILKGSSLIHHLVSAKDGSWLAAARNQDSLWLWHTSTRASTIIPNDEKVEIWKLAVAMDGSWLAAAGQRTRTSRRGPDEIKMWNPHDGSQLESVPAMRWRINALISSPDGSWLASASESTSIELHDLTGGSRNTTLHDADGGILNLAFSPDSSWLVSAGRGNAARVWDIATGTEQAAVPHPGTVLDVAVTPDGTGFVTVGADGAVRLFTPHGREWASVRLDSPLSHCVLNPRRAQVVVAGSHYLYFLDLHSGNSAQPEACS